ncbi:MAG: hypothetical protein ACYCYF_05195 [Anaerolineae bacterium]
MTDLLALNPLIVQTAITLTITAALFALSDRRLIVVPLALQYVLVASLLSPVIGLPLFAIRLTLGVAISAIMYITAGRVEHLLSPRTVTPPIQTNVRGSYQQLGPVFRLLAFGLAALLAVGVWSSNPLADVAGPVALSALWLGATGACMVIVSSDPLRIGTGLLVCISAFYAVYLTLESSLLVVALTGLVEILIALAVAYSTEVWLEAAISEAARP